MGQWLSVAEFAKIAGVSRQHIQKNIKRFKGAARKNKAQRNRTEIHHDKGLILLNSEFAPENRKRKDNTKATRETTKLDKSNTVLSYESGRRLNEQYKAKLKKLEYDEKRGALIERAEVVDHATAAGILIKEKLSSLPGRLGAMTAAESDPFECEQMLKVEINQVLEDLSIELGKYKEA